MDNYGNYDSKEVKKLKSKNLLNISQSLELLEQAFLTRRLQPWAVNVSKRVVKSPKLYYRDSGNLHYLSNIFDDDSLLKEVLTNLGELGFLSSQAIV